MALTHPSSITGQGTCPYSSRELKSINIYLYHIVHEQYRFKTATNDTTTTRNHHALIICIIHTSQHIIRCTQYTILTWYNVVRTENRRREQGSYCLLVLYDTVHMSRQLIGIIFDSSSSERWKRWSGINVLVVSYLLDNK